MGLVYHYTSPGGALGILQNKALWFTDCEFMNDPTELAYCYELYDRAWVEVCRELGMPENQIEQEITRFANPYECESIASEAVGASVPARYYALSTCMNGDDPAMWGNYASKGGKAGYSLALNGGALTQALEELASEASGFGIVTEVLHDQVCYDERAQFENIKWAIRKHLTRLGEAQGAGPDELGRIISSEIARADHWGQFGDIAPFIKRREFAYEKEYRFVLKMAQIDQPMAPKVAGCLHELARGNRRKRLLNPERFRGCRPESPIALHFREGIAGAMTPYLEVKFGEAWKGVLSVVRGHSYAAPDLVRDGMTQLVEGLRHKGVSVEVSDISLRS